MANRNGTIPMEIAEGTNYNWETTMDLQLFFPMENRDGIELYDDEHHG